MVVQRQSSWYHWQAKELLTVITHSENLNTSLSHVDIIKITQRESALNQIQWRGALDVFQLHVRMIQVKKRQVIHECDVDAGLCACAEHAIKSFKANGSNARGWLISSQIEYE